MQEQVVIGLGILGYAQQLLELRRPVQCAVGDVAVVQADPRRIDGEPLSEPAEIDGPTAGRMIERMVADAESHAEEDKKALELVNARNACEALVHTVKKSLKDHGDKLEADEKSKLEAALKEAEAALKSESKPDIEAKAEALAKPD